MKQGKTNLPPLDYLLAFEAAAEGQSFVGASKKLNISETAISRKVRLLELHYDVPLFLRGHRSISLTPQGVAFLARIEPALQMLRDASRKIVVDQKQRPVTIAATNSVAALWLMPRLQQFNSQNRHVKIMLVASDSDAECLTDTIDLAILRGEGTWPGFTAHRLFGETVFPVCAPAYLAAHPEAAEITQLSKLDLIAVASNHLEWLTWARWLELAGYPTQDLEQAALFNTYPMAVQAAVDGLGVALGWAHLVDHLLEQGKLVKVAPETAVRTRSGYYLLRSDRAKPFDECLIVEEWLHGLSARRERYGE